MPIIGCPRRAMPAAAVITPFSRESVRRLNARMQRHLTTDGPEVGAAMSSAAEGARKSGGDEPGEDCGFFALSQFPGAAGEWSVRFWWRWRLDDVNAVCAGSGNPAAGVRFRPRCGTGRPGRAGVAGMAPHPVLVQVRYAAPRRFQPTRLPAELAACTVCRWMFAHGQSGTCAGYPAHPAVGSLPAIPVDRSPRMRS